MKKLIPLESLRAFAAIYVFFHHTLYTFELLDFKSLLWYVFLFGQEAVILFFILSGYVISLSLYKNNYSFKVYFLYRFTRIYSVFFISIIVSYICFLVYDLNSIVEYKDILMNIFMFQDKGSFHPGNFAEPLFNNQPLWSLGFEWWFYMIFFLHFYFAKNLSDYTNINISFCISLIGILTYFFVNNQISTFLIYYFVWYSGVALYLNQKNSNNILVYYYLFLSILLIIVYYFVYLKGVSYTKSYIYPWITLRHFLGYLFFITTFIVFKKLIEKMVKIKLINNINKFFTFFASFSFAIYIFHYPIMNAVNIMQWGGKNKLMMTIFLTLVISYLTEVILYKKFKNLVFNYFKVSK